MNMNKPIADAKSLYRILQESARLLQTCTGVEPDVKEMLFANELRNRVVSDVVSLLENNGYPISFIRTYPVGGEVVDSFGHQIKLTKLFANGEYDVIINAINDLFSQGRKGG